jgi:hypothetical protein
VARAVRTSGFTWCSPARPITCIAASATRISAVAPIGLVESTPPEGFTGIGPSISEPPASMKAPPPPGGQKRRFSHIASSA